ncbi:MAG TPA: hypothetical protein VD816_04605 [Ohtaekwangia sp.]|nr:hypothetical protein [Ohtaekwangia sp.]
MGRLTERVDELIQKYKQDHRQEPPLYIILSPEDAGQLTEEARDQANTPEDDIVTIYRDCKIVHSMSVKKGAYYVSNEMPETGS